MKNKLLKHAALWEEDEVVVRLARYTYELEYEAKGDNGLSILFCPGSEQGKMQIVVCINQEYIHFELEITIDILVFDNIKINCLPLQHLPF